MTTTLNLPDDVARAVERRAAAGGRDMAAEVVELVRKGLAVSEHAQPAAALAPPVISTDPVTGLPVILSPPDAPIHRMTAAEFQAVVDAANEEDDLGRAGLPLRR
jgi:plasmid stability protein